MVTVQSGGRHGVAPDDYDDHDDTEDDDDHDARKIALCDWTLLDGVELGLPEITD